jgi:hypothetical protein
MRQVGVGFRLHTGWAAAVAFSPSPSAGEVVDRRRIALVANTDHDSVFVYHAAAERDADEASRWVTKAREVAKDFAVRAVGQMVADLKAAGFGVRSVGLPSASRRAAQPLEAILRAHTLIHAAEGELFQGALAAACDTHGLRVVEVLPKELYERAARVSGLRTDRLKRWLTELGRVWGPPWTADQKEAALAALIACHVRWTSGGTPS